MDNYLKKLSRDDRKYIKVTVIFAFFMGALVVQFVPPIIELILSFNQLTATVFILDLMYSPLSWIIFIGYCLFFFLMQRYEKRVVNAT